MAKRTVRLHLVGFTSDLKDLVLSTRRGAQSGSYHLEAGERLRRALEEADRLVVEAAGAEPEPEMPRDRSASSLNPREIQGMLREGKSAEEVARLAGTDVAWIERFTAPILAERAGIIELVRAGVLTRARLGPSSATIGEAIDSGIQAGRIQAPDSPDDAWSAIKRDGEWHVFFDFATRGQKKRASFSFNPATREVRALDEPAAQLGWQAPEAPPDRPRRRAKPAARGPKRPARKR